MQSISVSFLLATFVGTLALKQQHLQPISVPAAQAGLPVVLWHGMGDFAVNPMSMGAIKKHIEQSIGVYVHSISTGGNAVTDFGSSYYGDVHKQVDRVCKQLQDDEKLQGGYNGIGFSQGGQFFRALVQKCQHKGPKMHKLITMGGQHQGVMSAPDCSGFNQTGMDEGVVCSSIMAVLSRLAYMPWFRSRIVQAQYFKDPYRGDAYLEHNTFLPDINNELQQKNEVYRQNLVTLERLILFRFTNDTIVVPRDSAWFSYDNGTALVPVTDLPIYTGDWIGLRQLDEEGKLEFKECPYQHMSFSLKWFHENVVLPYLAQ